MSDYPRLAEVWTGGTCRRDSMKFSAWRLHTLLLLAECDVLTEPQMLSATRSVCRSLRAFLEEHFGLYAKGKTEGEHVDRYQKHPGKAKTR